MNKTLMYLLGYLTEAQWRSAFSECDKASIASYLKKVYAHYNMEIENDKFKAKIDYYK